MFDLLLNLPLFRGVSQARLAKIVGNIKLHFLKYPAGERIITAGDSCEHITFVISGSVRSTIVNANGRFAVSQTLSSPSVLAPDFLFGRFTHYPSTVDALTQASILQISKPDYVHILNSDPVFLFNYLNIVSVNAQKATQGLLALTDGEVDSRIAYWIIALTQPGATDIRLTCRKRDLCSLFGMQRSAFDARLSGMQERGLLTYNNYEIAIKDRKDMLGLLEKNVEEAHSEAEDKD